jgi:pimeloyl-ACP methyl ester carboxylesterase
MMKKLNLLFIFALLLSACARPFSYMPLKAMEELDYPYPVNKIQLDEGYQLAYMEQGPADAPVLLFIHGLGSYSPAWKKQLAELSKNYRCIAIDLPGYGKSTKGEYEGGMAFNAKLVLLMADKLGLKQFTLIGHSMGGQIAITAALLAPERISRLILASPAGFETFDVGEKAWFRDVVTARGTKLTPAKAIVQNYHSNFYNFPDDADFMIRDRLAMRTAVDFDWYCYIIPKGVQGMVNEPIYNRLPELKMPVLVIFGANDQLIPNRYLNGGTTASIAAAAKHIPNHTLVLLPKVGHFVQFEGAEAFNAAVLNFLK